MVDLGSALKKLAEGAVDLPAIRAEADSLANANSYSGPQGKEAIQHVYTSAMLALRHGSNLSFILGDIREHYSTPLPGPAGQDSRNDMYRDLWNNEVGLQIAAYIIENNLPVNTLNDLVIDAMDSGVAIWVYRDDPASGAVRDPRIDLGFSGSPSDFDTSVVPPYAPSSPLGSSKGGGTAVVLSYEEYQRLLGQNSPAFNPDHCFLAGTPISMLDGTEKPIEDLEEGDWVMSYDEHGNLVPGRVSRTMQNDVRNILDVHGLMVTPGHVTLCGDGPFAGEHVPIIDILRSDGALVREDGSKVRAGTGCALGTEGDRMMWAIAGERQPDGSIKVQDIGKIRAGTRVITEQGRDVSALDLIAGGGDTLGANGLIRRSGDGREVPFFWPFGSMLPKPEDYVLQRSGLRLHEIYRAEEWEAMGPQVPPPGSGPAQERRAEMDFPPAGKGKATVN